jgi:hypothetical protein
LFLQDPEPGKVFVSVIEHRGGRKTGCFYRTIQVDPWELATDSDGFNVIPHLVVRSTQA